MGSQNQFQQPQQFPQLQQQGQQQNSKQQGVKIRGKANRGLSATKAPLRPRIKILLNPRIVTSTWFAYCFNCGEPGHNKTQCSVPPFCFICNSTTHKDDKCPTRKLPLPAASLYGRADPGLEFYHIEVPEGNGKDASAMNVGIVYIEAREISKEDLAKEFAVIYKTTWPWQIRQLGE